MLLGITTRRIDRNGRLANVASASIIGRGNCRKRNTAPAADQELSFFQYLAGNRLWRSSRPCRSSVGGEGAIGVLAPSIGLSVPALVTHTVELEPGAEDCWLRLSHDAATDDSGSPLSLVFVDHLGFE